MRPRLPLCAYIACFCKPTGKEDFLHGLLSQWRGYGTDGGYALQFSRQKLEAALKGSQLRMYELADVHYSPENPLKDQLLSHKHAFLAAFGKHLDELAEPIDSSKSTWTSPLPDLFNGPLESLIDHLVYTKNQHFSEEREVRLCAMRPARLDSDERRIDFFNRNGLLVPYITIPKEEQNILDCVDWILIGPGPRVESRFKSITTLIAESGKDIKVRASHIPYTRL